jgi:hypothetical protein
LTYRISYFWFWCSLIFFFFLSFFFCGTGASTQGLYLEPLHQSFFVMNFFEIGSRKLFECPGWVWTARIARITEVSHQHPAFLMWSNFLQTTESVNKHSFLWMI